jgi:serine/threonine protein kinase
MLFFSFEFAIFFTGIVATIIGHSTEDSMEREQEHSLPNLEGSEARVFLLPGGIAVRKLKHRSSATAMTDPQKLLQISKHPNVVRIFSIENGDIHMEAMHVSLQENMPAVPPYSFPCKLHIAHSVAQGLRHLHSHGMEHGDLCPANILLAWQACTPAAFKTDTHGEMQVKLCDFYNEHTGTNRTAAYAAPEVVRCTPRTMPAADVWAFACCLLFLEGVQPFNGFEEDPAVLYYLAVNGCVAFIKDAAVMQFTLHDCAYAPARHIGQTAWAHILAGAFAPEPTRFTSQQLCDSLAPLHAHAHTHSPPKTEQRKRAALRRLNFN